MHPDTQRSVFDNDKSLYLAEARAADWDGLTWRIDDMIDEDNGWYTVFVLADPPNGVPAFLFDRGLGQKDAKGGAEITGFVVGVHFGDGGRGIYFLPQD